MKKTLRIGSRGSQLARWQANHVAELLRARGFAVEIEIIKTTGDRITDISLAKVGTKGMFTKEIEEALADKHVDLAVHSLKDLPTDVAPEFKITAVLQREDARDALVSEKYARLGDLPQGARVGTSSLRREAQLRAFRSDLEIKSLRGNVDTRLRKLEAGEFDAVILAAAGLRRLGREKAIREMISVERMCPAAGQGALAIEIRSSDAELEGGLASLDDAAARMATECERALLRTLGGGCQVPIGAYAQTGNQGMELTAVVAHPNGTSVLREAGEGSEPLQLGRIVGRRLLERGAQKILDDVYGKPAAAPQQP